MTEFNPCSLLNVNVVIPVLVDDEIPVMVGLISNEVKNLSIVSLVILFLTSFVATFPIGAREA